MNDSPLRRGGELKSWKKGEVKKRETIPGLEPGNKE